MATDYSKTVHLPATQFPQKADLPRREPQFQEFWEKGRVYARMLEARSGSPEYVLHDGPPYANGHIHIGHSLNKILKDMVVKSRAMAGLKTPIVFGWDCHGLPIEQALLKEMKINQRGVQDIPAFRVKAEEFARRFIDIQRLEFKRLGCLGEWDHPYVTMSRAYEARVLRAFRLLFQKGFVYRGLKTVSWCVYCETALAEAEVEYKDKTSPSVYVALKITESSALKSAGLWTGAEEALIWTTTPWTLPANMAVAFHPSLEYALAETRPGPGVGLPAAGGKPRRLLLAKPRLEAVMDALHAPPPKILGSWKGGELAPEAGSKGALRFVCEAPFGGRRSLGVLAGYVTAEDGTGIVHTAPGHGADDFETGRRYGLSPVLSPVDASGRFTQEAGPDFAGRHIFKEGNPAVIDALKAAGSLLAEASVSHSYPHCWRCKNPIAFRAAEQWFLSVEHEELRQKLQAAVDSVRWIPEAGKARISSMVRNRPDWCLSRQRVWGTPIPILYCASCNEVLRDDGVLKAVEDRVERDGDAFWFADWGRPVRLRGPKSAAPQRPSEAALPRDSARSAAPASGEALTWNFLERDMRCACGGELFRRETDILDVWMDSGASWLAVLDGQVPCDLYLEGSDQHRGWFQSSLVLSVALTGRPPFKTVLTHGFVLDDQGRAMHKSLGNVVSPQEAIQKYGADVLRLWVALADYSDDVRLSDKLMEGPVEAYRKIRNTLRYLLGNLFDFDPARHAVEFRRMTDLDRYLLHRLSRMARDILDAYEQFRFRAAARALTDFCNLDLSAFYLSACKDRLYTLAADAPERRGAQTVLFEILRRLLPLTAPILSFTAEEAWRELRRMLAELGSEFAAPESVFLSRFPEIPPEWTDDALAERWRIVLDIRSRVNRTIEEQRARGLVGGSLEAKVGLKGGAAAERPVLEGYKDLWPEILIVSQADVHPDGGELSIEVGKAEGAKCARCWRYQADVGSAPSAPDLCGRCVRQLAAR